MARDKAFSSIDYSEVEPLLVRPSSGGHPNAAVAWSELERATEGLVRSQQLEEAMASLFLDIPLVGGITESRPALEGAGQYFYTRFELDLVALGGQVWGTQKINDDCLLDSLGNRQQVLYNFKITANGTCTIEFQGLSNPVISDSEYTLVVQRRPKDSLTLGQNSTYTFPNGGKIQVNSDFTVELFDAATASQGALLALANYPNTKVKKTGFMVTDDGGDNFRYSLSPNGFVLPGVPISWVEYNNF